MTLTPSSNRVAAPQSARAARLITFARLIRARARLISALVLLSFVLCHLASHITLIVSVPLAEQVLDSLMSFWRTEPGTYLLATGLAVHVLNALWSIYIRRYLRLPVWELAQLSLFGTASSYHSVLTNQWFVTPGLVYLQFAAVLTLWVHACIGLHFWLRTKRWYPAWLPILGTLGVLVPSLALAGYISGGNQILREVQNPDVLASIRENAHQTPETIAQVWHMAFIGVTIYAGLVLLPFIGRGVRGFVYRTHRLPQLTHSNGRTMAMLPGASVLETLRANGIPHASVCGGRARCTTCRV